MRKTIFVLLVTILLLGLLSACRNEPAQSQEDETTVPTDEIFVEDVFGDPTGDTNSQNQDPTKATEDQNNTNSTQNQQNPGTSQSAQGTTPTQGQQNSGSAPSTDPTTTPTQPEDPTTKPTQPTEEPTEQPTQSTELTGLAAEYKAYNNMTAAEKQKFRETFENNTAFFKWYNEALKAYKEATPPTPIPPDGNITLN